MHGASKLIEAHHRFGRALRGRLGGDGGGGLDGGPGRERLLGLSQHHLVGCADGTWRGDRARSIAVAAACYRSADARLRWSHEEVMEEARAACAPAQRERRV
jgi:hypothetical protein